MSGDVSAVARQGEPHTRPIFILTCPRSGSTLLRYLIDTHPHIACPPEVNASAVCAAIVNGWLAVDGRDATFEDRRGRGIRRARQVTEELLGWFAAGQGKPRWCEKSLTSAEQAELLLEVFPDAQFLTLYRHPMDMIYSGVEACTWGFGAFGFAPYVQRSPGNTVAALLELWLDHTEAIWRFETAHPEACYRLYYEVLVTDTTTTMNGVFDFLGAEADHEIVKRALKREHMVGSEDWKAGFETRVRQDSVGRGARVPVDHVGPLQRERANRLLSALDYPLVTEDWNRGTSPLRQGAPAASPAEYPAGRELAERLISAYRADNGDPHRAIRLVVDGCAGSSSWRVDRAEGTVQMCPAEEDAVVLIDDVALPDLNGGRVHPAVAVERGEVRVFTKRKGEKVSQEEMRRIVSALASEPDAEAARPDGAVDGTAEVERGG